MAFVQPFPITSSLPSRRQYPTSRRALWTSLSPQRRAFYPPQKHRSCTMTVEAPTENKLMNFLRNAGDLGTIRFVAVTGGMNIVLDNEQAVVETIGRFDYPITSFTIPNKGHYISINSEDGVFACNINMDKVTRVTLSKEPAKQGDADIYVIRLLDQAGGIVLSCLLMWNPAEGPGHYLAGAVEAFEKLKMKYGESFEL